MNRKGSGPQEVRKLRLGAMARFTDDYLAGLTLPEGKRDRLVFDEDVRGLGVRVTARSKTFLVQWTDPATGQKQREPLGTWGNVTIKAARDAAKIKLGKVASGVNPRAERISAKAEAEKQRAEKALTLEKLIADWETLHLINRRPGYAAEAVRALRVAFANMLTKPASRITKADVVNRLDELSAAGKHTTAARTMAYGRAAYAWARKRDKVSNNPFFELPIPAASNERDRVLSKAEVGEVWKAAGQLPYPVGQFYRLALLTTVRRNEIAGMRWSEIYVDAAEWTVPASRSKNGKSHVVHLSSAAIEVLNAITRVKGQDLVLTTTGSTPISGFSKFKRALDAEIIANRAKAAEETGAQPDSVEPFHLHDFRRTCVSTLAAIGFDSIVADKLLSHQPKRLRGTAKIYQRYDFAKERARALDAWASYCTGTDEPAESTK